MKEMISACKAPESGWAVPDRPGSFVCDRWQVLDLVKQTAPALGLKDREIAVLAAHLSLLPKGPVRSDQLLMSYAEIGGILGRANCMEERRFRRGEARLEELGLIVRKLSANGRRYPVRDGQGVVRDAYGIDLRPLFLRVAELTELADRLRAEQAERDARRSAISARLSAIKRRFLAAGRALPDAFESFAVEARNLLRRARTTLCEMASLERELGALESVIEAPALSEASPAAPDKTAADAGQNDRHSESPRKDNIKSAPVVDDTAILRAWSQCENLVGFYPDSPRSPHEAMKVLYEIFGFLGLGQTLRERCVAAFGPAQSFTVLDDLCGRIHKISNVAGYVSKMIDSYQSGSPVAGGRIRLREKACV